MRIGINTLYLLPGGVGGTETYLRRLLDALQAIDRQNQYFVYTNAENAGSFPLTASGFEERPCDVRAASRSARILFEQIVLPRRAKSDGIDVLHSPGYTAPISLACASVVTIHDLNYHFFPEDWSRAALVANRILIPRVARSATRVLTDSHSSARDIREVLRVPEHRLDVVHLGCDGNLVASDADDERRIREKHRLDGPFIFAVTASHPHKNLDGLLRAYDLSVRGWSEPLPLVLVGIQGRHQARLVETLRRRQAPGRVVLVGWVDEKELAALYRAATLFVHASKYEGFGFPVLEAMTAGTPVVSSNAASLPELVGDAGVTVDPDDHAALAAAIRRVVADEALRRELSARGMRQASRFTWSAAAEATLASYRLAFEERPRAR